MTDTHSYTQQRLKVANKAKALKTSGKRIGFTSGAFDLLHAGHARYLKEAKKLCDYLIVAVNTDRSVREYKGEKRPLIPEVERLELIQALASVDAAYLFDERRNRDNLTIIQPNYYIKAGDYDEKSLTSSDVLKAWGGETRFVPFHAGLSTTEIIESISRKYPALESEREDIGKKARPVVFLDRDGTINREIEYLHEPDQFEFLPNALEGMKKLQELGFPLAIVTTQAGIALGYFSKEDFYKVNRAMLRGVSREGILIEKIYFSPYGKAGDPPCRKPNTYLFERAEREIPAKLKESFMIGDKTSDILAGQRIGAYTILVKTGHAGEDGEYDIQANYTATDLLDAARHIESLVVHG